MGRIIQGIDPIDSVKKVNRDTKTHCAILLSELEELLGKDNPNFPQVRKLVLDNFNNYKRNVYKVIFGTDFEDIF
jgi:hypothetical protein